MSFNVMQGQSRKKENVIGILYKKNNMCICKLTTVCGFFMCNSISKYYGASRCFSATAELVVFKKGKQIFVWRKKLTSEALRCGSHSFHTANTPHLPLSRKHSPDGATSSDSSHLITALHYIFSFRLHYLMASNVSDVGLLNSSSKNRRRSTTQRDAVGGRKRVAHLRRVW